jgi:hypothetical protein
MFRVKTLDVHKMCTWLESRQALQRALLSGHGSDAGVMGQQTAWPEPDSRRGLRESCAEACADRNSTCVALTVVAWHLSALRLRSSRGTAQATHG